MQFTTRARATLLARSVSIGDTYTKLHFAGNALLQYLSCHVRFMDADKSPVDFLSAVPEAKGNSFEKMPAMQLHSGNYGTASRHKFRDYDGR